MHQASVMSEQENDAKRKVEAMREEQLKTRGDVLGAEGFAQVRSGVKRDTGSYGGILFVFWCSFLFWGWCWFDWLVLVCLALTRFASL